MEQDAGTDGTDPKQQYSDQGHLESKDNPRNPQKPEKPFRALPRRSGTVPFTLKSAKRGSSEAVERKKRHRKREHNRYDIEILNHPLTLS